MKITSALALLFAFGCSLDDAEPICEVGATQACVCSTGEPGAQKCEEDGFAWGECKCEEPPAPEACERDADCEDASKPLCIDFECSDGDDITILPGGARCDVPRSRCDDGLACDPELLRCITVPDQD